MIFLFKTHSPRKVVKLFIIILNKRHVIKGAIYDKIVDIFFLLKVLPAMLYKFGGVRKMRADVYRVSAKHFVKRDINKNIEDIPKHFIPFHLRSLPAQRGTAH